MSIGNIEWHPFDSSGAPETKVVQADGNRMLMSYTVEGFPPITTDEQVYFLCLGNSGDRNDEEIQVTVGLTDYDRAKMLFILWREDYLD